MQIIQSRYQTYRSIAAISNHIEPTQLNVPGTDLIMKVSDPVHGQTGFPTGEGYHIDPGNTIQHGCDGIESHMPGLGGASHAVRACGIAFTGDLYHQFFDPHNASRLIFETGIFLLGLT
jgi:hypothetical protein